MACEGDTEPDASGSDLFAESCQNRNDWKGLCCRLPPRFVDVV